MALLRHTLAPRLIGREASGSTGSGTTCCGPRTRRRWGAITSLALAAVDTALWDLRCRRAGLPLWMLAGGSRDRIPVYSTEGGWLNLSEAELAEQAAQARSDGFRGAKMKIGKPSGVEDARRIAAVRAAVGGRFRG